jgi:DNA-binding MarR family transcriptional regulator
MVLNTVTRTEAKVLRAVPEFDTAIPYELANPTQLTPTEVSTVLLRLADKGLAELLEDGRMVKLTDEGRRIHRLLERFRKKRQWGASIEDVLVVPDEEAGELAGDLTSDEADIDSALDAEISRMSEAMSEGKAL